MNYRHAYHAGNFGDVFKHAILARCIEYLKRKEAAFRVIDTHAGAGLYDLSSAQAQKTGEWRDGVGRLLASDCPAGAAALLEPYLAIVREYAGDGGVSAYPGSPTIARRLLRRQDRLSAFELHEEDCATLAARFAGDYQARISLLDGWLVPGAHLPPKEKRGLVLIDPPFEQPGDFDRLADALERGVARWPGGMFALWYPIKHDREIAAFHARLARSGMRDILRTELCVTGRTEEPAFRGCGVIVKNPPFVLLDELGVLLPALAAMLGRDAKASWLADMLVPE
jgi:23S rRNA (adenine2030-N6)-methyltransferase